MVTLYTIHLLYNKKICTNKNPFSANAVYLFYKFEIEQGLEFKRVSFSKATK